MFDYAPHYRSANSNFRSAPDMSWSDLALVWSFWVVNLTTCFVFTQPDISVPMVNTVWMLTWTLGIVRAVCLISEAQDVDDARSHGFDSSNYIKVMTDRPMPSMTVGVVSNGILFSVAISCFIAGFQFLGGLSLFSSFMSMALFSVRRAYHSSIGH